MGLGYAENDWILWEVQERSSLAFRYAIDHSPLTTWRLVKPGGAGGGLETSKSRPNERKNIFSPKWLTTVQQKKREKKEELGYRTNEKWEKWAGTSNEVVLELLQVTGNESFYTVMPDILYFLLDTSMWIPHKACHASFFIWCCHVCFFFLPWPASPVWPTSDSSKLKNTPNFRGWNKHIVPASWRLLCWITPRPRALRERLPFPLSPLSYIQMGRIFYFLFFFFSCLLLCNKT